MIIITILLQETVEKRMAPPVKKLLRMDEHNIGKLKKRISNLQ